MRKILLIGTGCDTTKSTAFEIGALLLDSIGIEATQVHIVDLPVASTKLVEPASYDTTIDDKAKWKQMLQDLEKTYPDIGDIAFIKESNDWIEYDFKEGTSYYIPQKDYCLKKQHQHGDFSKKRYRRSPHHRRTPKHCPFTGRHSISQRRGRRIPLQRAQNCS